MKRECDRPAERNPALKRLAEAGAKAQAAKPEDGDETLSQVVGFRTDSTPGQRNIAGILCRGGFRILLEPSDKAIAGKSCTGSRRMVFCLQGAPAGA
jgi:hypothetical protein